MRPLWRKTAVEPRTLDMFIFTNAFKNLIRNKSRYITVGVFLFLIVSVMIASLLLTNESEKNIFEQKNYYGSRIWIDYKDKQADNIEYYTTKDFFEKFSDSKYVRDLSVGYAEEVYIQNKNESELKLLFGIDIEKMEEFELGMLKINEGNKYSDNEECIINKSKYDELNLKIGDYIDILDAANTSLMKLKIVGTFSSGSADDSKVIMQIDDISYLLTDIIFANFNTSYYSLNKDEQSDEFKKLHTFKKYKHKYFLNNADEMAEFAEEVHSRGLPDDLSCKFDEIRYKTMTEPLNQLKRITNIFAAAMIIIAAIILIMMIILLLRERRYEIGVLFTVGVSKPKIIINFICEIFIFILLITSASIAGGKLAAGIIIKKYLPEMMSVFIFDISVTPVLILQLFVFTVSVVLLSASITSAFILRFSPVKILSEQ